MSIEIKWQNLSLQQQRVLAAVVMSAKEPQSATRSSIARHMNVLFADLDEPLLLLKDHKLVHEQEKTEDGKLAGTITLTPEGEKMLYEMLEAEPIIKDYSDQQIRQVLRSKLPAARSAQWDLLCEAVLANGMNERYRPGLLSLLPEPPDPKAAVKIQSLDVTSDSADAAEQLDHSQRSEIAQQWKGLYNGLSHLMEFKKKMGPPAIDIGDPKLYQRLTEIVENIVLARTHTLNGHISQLQNQMSGLQRQIIDLQRRVDFRAGIGSPSTKPPGAER